MIAFSCAPKDRLSSLGGCTLVGAFAATGGTDIRDAKGADEGARRLAWGLHEVAIPAQLRMSSKSNVAHAQATYGVPHLALASMLSSPSISAVPHPRFSGHWLVLAVVW